MIRKMFERWPTRLHATTLAVLVCWGCESTPKENATAPAVAEGDHTLEGDSVPDVALITQDGKELRFAQLAGKNVVLFFYPKDNTSGCRIEAQGFRDTIEDFNGENTVVLGVSMQGAESHESFIDNEQLPYDLIVDETGAVAKAFGVAINGDTSARDTILVGKDGKIRRVWRGVSPKGHAREVFAALTE